jgi:hypothetical protein
MIDSTAPRPVAIRRARSAHAYRWPTITRRGVQVTLGVLWLVDAALQLQPFMFTSGFARQVLAPSGQNQPAWVGAPIDVLTRLIAGHPAPLNAGFALVQLALGVGFLLPRLVRPAIVGTVAWSAGIWWFGEGLGGLATGHASLVTGAPGAVLLYALLAAAVWPLDADQQPGPARVVLARWFPAAWAALWVGGAVLQLLPGQAGGAALADQVGGMAGMDGMPLWLSRLHEGAGAALSNAGNGPFIALVAVMALVGVGGFASRPWRTASAVVGAVLATVFWVVGQNIGDLYSGRATDPNTGPLIVVMAVALLGSRASTSRPDAVHTFATGSNPQQPSAANQQRPQPDEVTGSGHPMNNRKGPLGLLIAVPLLLTGCAAAEATTGHVATIRPAISSPSTSPSKSPGMSMSPGESMPGMASTTAALGVQLPVMAAGPSKAAQMICGPETQRNVATLMALHASASTKATWVDHSYTCTYQLPGGPLVLSVKESAGVAAARSYFAAMRARSGHTTTLSGLVGLGLPAFEDTTGKVVFLKDNMTLQVNPTALPPKVGPQQTSRADFAYTLATDILACWSE